MSASPAKLFVSVAEDSVWLRIVGRANFTSSVDFKTLVGELRQKGFHHYVIDLSECVLMDSTFLGVLAGFGLKVNEPGQNSAARAIELLNVNVRITELLENLGVLHLFKIAAGQPAIPSDARSEESETHAHTKEELKRTSLEAHTTLMQIAPANIPKFKEVTQFLSEDLKKLGRPQ